MRQLLIGFFLLGFATAATAGSPHSPSPPRTPQPVGSFSPTVINTTPMDGSISPGTAGTPSGNTIVSPGFGNFAIKNFGVINNAPLNEGAIKSSVSGSVINDPASVTSNTVLSLTYGNVVINQINTGN
jgi:hypothetical protein